MVASKNLPNKHPDWQSVLSSIPSEIALTPVKSKRSLRDSWASEPIIPRGELLSLLKKGQWLDKRDVKPGEAKQWLCRWDGIGIRLGEISNGLLAIDQDGPSAIEKIQELSGNQKLPKTVTFTSGRTGRAQYLYRVPKGFWPAIETTKYKTGVIDADGEIEQLEFRWNQCQSVIPPSRHPDTEGYFYLDGCGFGECEIALAETWMIEAMLIDVSKHPESQQNPATAEQIPSSKLGYTNKDWALSYLAALSPSRADDYDTWVGVGMSLHSIGDDSLLEDWEKWSQQSAKYQPKDCDRKWKSFKREGVSIASLGRLAKLDGWQSPLERQVRGNKQSVGNATTLPADSRNVDPESYPATVGSVGAILEKGLHTWQERIELEKILVQSGMSEMAYWLLVEQEKCRRDIASDADKSNFELLISWRDTKLDFRACLPHMADELLHDAEVLNIDPISLWQYLLPAVLSLLGSKCSLNMQSHKIPSLIWTCLVAESGTGKSRAESVILAPLKEWQQEEFKRFRQDSDAYQEELKNKKQDDEESPEKPRPERKYLFEVATIQAVMRRLSEQDGKGSLWARDEISGLFGSLGQFSRNENEGLECLLKAWDGCPAQVDRVLVEDSFNIAETRLSLSGGVQPGIYRKVFKDADDSNGMQARFLFALPQIKPPKRVKAACKLADKLPVIYKWLDQEFPGGEIKLSADADIRFDAIYEQIGVQAELGSTAAIRVWMRKLPTQLLRICLALHAIECYHQPSRPENEIQLDTLNRAIQFARYYRAAFQSLQGTTADVDDTAAILLKIWDMAAAATAGVTPRDIYRNFRSIQRLAKEQKRTAAAYVVDLFYQLESMGRGVVVHKGREIRFQISNNPKKAPTVPTVNKTSYQSASQVSTPFDTAVPTVDDIEVNDEKSSDVEVPTVDDMELNGENPDDDPPGGGGVSGTPKPPDDDGGGGVSTSDLPADNDDGGQETSTSIEDDRELVKPTTKDGKPALSIDASRLNLHRPSGVELEPWQPILKVKPYEQLKRAIIDIETTGLDPKDSRIIAIGLKMGDEIEIISDRDESQILKRFNELLNRWRPDVLAAHNGMNFDWPFIIQRCLAHGLKPPFEQAEKERCLRATSVNGKSIFYKEISAKNHHINLVDTYHLIALFNFSARKLPNLKLKDSVLTLGLRTEQRLELSASEIHESWESGNFERIAEYLHYDLEDAELLMDCFLPQYHYQSLVVPKMGLQQLVLSGNATKWQRILKDHYGNSPEADEIPHCVGALRFSPAAGLFRNVAQVDVSSLYPSIMLRYGICSAKDSDRQSLRILQYLTQERLRLKALGRTDPEAKRQSDALKILLNSLTGLFNTKGIGYNDPVAFSLVTAYGRAILQLMTDTIVASGGQIVSADTDGVAFSAADIPNIYAKLVDALPDGIQLDPNYESFDAMFIPGGLGDEGARCTYLYWKDGKVGSNGGRYTNRNNARFKRDYETGFLSAYLADGLESAEAYHDEFISRLGSGDFPIELLSCKRIVQQNSKFKHLGTVGEKATYWMGEGGTYTNSEPYNIGHYIYEVNQLNWEILQVLGYQKTKPSRRKAGASGRDAQLSIELEVN